MTERRVGRSLRPMEIAHAVVDKRVVAKIDIELSNKGLQLSTDNRVNHVIANSGVLTRKFRLLSIINIAPLD